MKKWVMSRCLLDNTSRGGEHTCGSFAVGGKGEGQEAGADRLCHDQVWNRRRAHSPRRDVQGPPHQFLSFAALKVGEEAEAILAKAFQQQHAGGGLPVPEGKRRTAGSGPTSRVQLLCPCPEMSRYHPQQCPLCTHPNLALPFPCAPEHLSWHIQVGHHCPQKPYIEAQE